MIRRMILLIVFLLLLEKLNLNFSFNFKVENIKILPGTYDVVVSQKLLSRFTSKNHGFNLLYLVILQ